MKNPLFSHLFLPVAIIGCSAGFSTVVQAEQEIRGLATWYGPGLIGNRTANGEMFNPQALTAAHRSLPFGTQIRVTNVKNGRSVVVRINDRLGDPGVEIDLSMGAAQAIGLTVTSPVKMEILSSK
jgi:rare lipoprotein A